MANAFREVIELRPELRRGQWLLMLVPAFACGLALLCVDLPPAGRLALFGLVLVRLGLEWRSRLARCHPAYVARVLLLPDGRWRLETGRGRQHEARLLHAWGRALGPVIALEWACDDGRRRRAWIWQRHYPAAHWRRLRVRLRLA